MPISALPATKLAFADRGRDAAEIIDDEQEPLWAAARSAGGAQLRMARASSPRTEKVYHGRTMRGPERVPKDMRLCRPLCRAGRSSRGPGQSRPYWLRDRARLEQDLLVFYDGEVLLAIRMRDGVGREDDLDAIVRDLAASGRRDDQLSADGALAIGLVGPSRRPERPPGMNCSGTSVKVESSKKSFASKMS